MNDHSDVSAIVTLQLVLYALAWMGAAKVVPAVRHTAHHWAAAFALGAAALFPLAAGNALSPWFSKCLSGVLLVLSFTAVARGARAFHRMRLPDGEYIGVLLAAATALFALGPDAVNDSLRSAIVAGVLALIVVRSMIATWEPTTAEFGRVGAWPLFAPALLLAAVLAGAAVWRVRGGPPFVGSMVELPAMVILLILGAVLNVSLAALLALRLRRELYHQARHDAMTGLLDRHAMREPLEEEWSRHERGAHVFSLLMLDVDHLRRVNDAHGLRSGDGVLAMVAGILEASRRPTDRAARFGGEEFLVLLPHTDAAGAGAAAERLRSFVAAARAPGVAGPVTVSVGIATVAADDTSIDRVIERTERALQAAKQAGRNRTVIDGDRGGAIMSSVVSAVGRATTAGGSSRSAIQRR